jgi:hypothetical protein|tara:strand:+ start:862 stop:1440 length:579 start_codon:yes stop_codon:yes gene_type:complete
MASYIFTDLLNKAPTELRSSATDARNWLDTNMKRTVTPGNLLSGEGSKTFAKRLTTRPSSGTLNMFLYTAKTPTSKLPYYDRFPLIFVTGMDRNGFTGMNLHYLPPLLRAKLFDSVSIDQERGGLSQGNIIAKASRLKYYKPCIKKYLNNRVQSRFVQVYPEEWYIALFLPTERFTTNKSRVFGDTIEKMNK